MGKTVDRRIRTLIENGVNTRHRSMLVMVGDEYHDQIATLHKILSKAYETSRPNVLWCHKNRLELSSQTKKRKRQLKLPRGNRLRDGQKVEPFSLFMDTAGVTLSFYHESESIIGKTFGMCILQDFEALTPNVLARSIETVRGGGLILVLIRSSSSFTSADAVFMDIRERFNTESTSRFTKRLLLSLSSCKTCILTDDKLKVLPISSSRINSIEPVLVREDSEELSDAKENLKRRKEELADVFPIAPLIEKCCTLDQERAIVTFMGAILDKALKSTVACFAPRGRGKSASLGLAIAGAVAVGYPSIYVTAPSREDVKTLFDFVCRGLDALGYKEHYDVVRSTDPELKKAVVRININKQSQQTVQYIEPTEHEKLSQVDLMVIDEAAAIPLPIVTSLLGPYTVFLSSTVNGYEGSGRSLSLKLIRQFEQQSQASSLSPITGGRFEKIELTESIGYASGDPIELWLHNLLCLDVANSVPELVKCPCPNECKLYYVNRDALFSYHKDCELFLQRMMAICTSSHYKNSPNDLQPMADDPAHHLFVLLGPDESENRHCDILCVIQVALEGHISSTVCQPHGDLIPLKFAEQFQDTVFSTLSGLRIVRIATHPDVTKRGYGSRAVQLLTEYYEGQFAPNSEMDIDNLEDMPPVSVVEAAKEASLLEETREPYLLYHLSERKPEKLHYMGVSFGLTLELLLFWRKHNFSPFIIGHTPSSIASEHPCIVLKPLKNNDVVANGSDKREFLGPFLQDFRLDFIHLLGDPFRSMELKLVMRVLDPKIKFSELESDWVLTSIKAGFSSHEIKRLEAYTQNLLDYHKIIKPVRKLAVLYFEEKLPITLTYAEACVLLCKGLQGQSISQIQVQIDIERQHVLSVLMRVMRKFHKYLFGLASQEIVP